MAFSTFLHSLFLPTLATLLKLSSDAFFRPVDVDIKKDFGAGLASNPRQAS